MTSFPRPFAICLLAGFSGFALDLRAAEKPVSFREQIAPILLEQCQTCHGPAQQKGGYRIDTFEFLSRNEDDTEPVLVPGKPEKSDLYTLLVADADDRMPHKADPLPKEQTELVKRWIAEGAKFDGPEPTAALVEIVPPRLHPKAPEAYLLPVPVTALAFSPDGSELFASGFCELTVWSAANGKLARRITNVAPRTFALAFSGDGALVAAASGAPGEYGEVRLFDSKTGEMRQQVGSSTDAFLDVKFSPDGTLLAAAGADHSLSIFDVASGARRQHLLVHSDAVTAVAFSPDSKQVASVSLDRTAKIFDAASGKLVATYRDHQAPLYAVVFTPDGKQVMTAGRDKAVHQWNMSDAKKQRELGGQGDVVRLLVSGGQLYLGGAGKKLAQANIADLKAGRTFEGLNDWIYSVAIHPTTQRIAAGCYDGTVAIWNLADGKAVTSFVASPGCKPDAVATSAAK
jgi:dipeptidyl aminopeptidase/acylaminoacyl peptidase